MSFWNKEVTCEECNVSFPKKQICVYDSTRQGRVKNERKINLCQKCVLIRLFKSFNKKAIIVHPLKKYKAYVYYSFDELLPSTWDSATHESAIRFVSALRKLTPPDNAVCNCCTNYASFTWCSPEVFDNNPYNTEVSPEDDFESVYLCKECLIKSFSGIVQSENISFSAIFPPAIDGDGDGYYTPWDV
jgi:hypothetical protein